MTDRDTIERVSQLVSVPVYSEPPTTRGRAIRPMYTVRFEGTKAAFVMTKILPFMSARRTQKIQTILRFEIGRYL